MALLIKESARMYNYLIHDLADHRMDYLPMVQSPIPMISILTVYLLFVFKWGPDYMKDRKAFDLKKILIIYNLVQVISCVLGVIIFTKYIPFSVWTCVPINSPYTNNREIQLGGYIYFILKIIDLLDTVFFVLKKNYRQLTFLHVFHHTMVIFNIWIGMKYFPGGQGCFIPYINTIVHAVMYGYYLLTLFDDKYKKSIWWKKHITQLQLLQFALIFILFTTPLIYDCDYPKAASILVLILNGSMVVLFSNFYYKTYIKKNKVV